MGSRIVPFDDDLVCDECGAKGAFDFMGDYYCGPCASQFIEKEEKQDELRNEDKKLTEFASAVSLQAISNLKR